MKNNLLVREVTLEQILSLRHAVLRPGCPEQEACFEGDNENGTRHFGSFSKDACIACLSLYPSTLDGVAAYRLRGMAVEPGHQGQGIGRNLLDVAIASVDHIPLWCNARTSAADFYIRAGWQQRGEEFLMDNIGPHVKMVYYPM